VNRLEGRGDAAGRVAVELTAVAPSVVPVVRTPDLVRSVGQYRDEFGFELQQMVRHVLAVLRLGSLRLHLWQAAEGFRAGIHRVVVSDAFSLHSALAQCGRPALSGPPVLQAWGAWEFTLHDADSNRLCLVQWAVPTRAA
jgi:hypothetical protein